MEVLALQQRLHAARALDQIPDHWLAGEHPAVFTQGVRATVDDLPAGLAERIGAHVVEIDRGGMTTLHSPGQVVIYPIVKLAAGSVGAGAFARALLEFMRDWMREEFGIEAEMPEKKPGLFVAGRKLLSIGISGRGGVTMHGVALNVCNDLALWEGFTACGDPAGRPITLAEVLGRGITPGEMVEGLDERIARWWGYASISRADGLDAANATDEDLNHR